MTGADLVRQIEAAARAGGTRLSAFVRPLTSDPNTYLRQLEQAMKPKPWTIERITALIEGRPVPPPPAKPQYLTIRRDDRRELGLEPSGREQREKYDLARQRAEKAFVEERLRICRLAHERKLPGETLHAAARLQRELRA